MHDLTAWLAGTASDPEVGALLQADAEAWVPFAQLLESIDPAIRDAEEWSTVDVSHHLAGWMRQAAEVVGRNEGWGPLVLDEVNAGFLAESRDLSFGQARLALEEARSQLRAALTGLSEPCRGRKAGVPRLDRRPLRGAPADARRLTGSDGSVA